MALTEHKSVREGKQSVVYNRKQGKKNDGVILRLVIASSFWFTAQYL